MNLARNLYVNTKKNRTILGFDKEKRVIGNGKKEGEPG